MAAVGSFHDGYFLAAASDADPFPGFLAYSWHSCFDGIWVSGDCLFYGRTGSDSGVSPLRRIRRDYHCLPSTANQPGAVWFVYAGTGWFGFGTLCKTRQVLVDGCHDSFAINFLNPEGAAVFPVGEYRFTKPCRSIQRSSQPF